MEAADTVKERMEPPEVIHELTDESHAEDAQALVSAVMKVEVVDCSFLLSEELLATTLLLRLAMSAAYVVSGEAVATEMPTVIVA